MNSEPTEGSGMIEALAWLEVNKKRLAIGAVVVIVVGFGIYVVNHLAEEKENNAAAALINLRARMNGTNEVNASSSDYLRVIDQYKGTRAAERAELLAAGALFSEGKYSEAQAQFNRLLSDHPESKWAPDAAYGVAASLESQKKTDEALAAYQKVVTAYASSSVVGDARMALARLYEAKNQPAEALKQYDEVMRGGSMGMSMAAQEASMRRDQVLKKHPELAKAPTNSVSTATIPSPVTLPTPTSKAPSTFTNSAPAKATNSTTTPKK